MKTKIKSKSNNNTKIKRQNKNRININDKIYKENQLPKKINPITQKNSKGKENEKKTGYNNNPSNIEDSSTNCLSGNKKKNFKSKLDDKLLNDKKFENFIIPFLITKDNDTESLFINFKLGEKDSYSESLLRNDSKIDNNNYANNIKLTNKNFNNYNYCEVDENIGKNEIDSLELYDFNDKSNVDYVLKNLSALSCSKSGKDKSSSIILDECNDEDISGNKKIINKIKIFNVKQNSPNFCSKIKVNKLNNNNFGDTLKENYN